MKLSNIDMTNILANINYVCALDILSLSGSKRLERTTCCKRESIITKIPIGNIIKL